MQIQPGFCVLPGTKAFHSVKGDPRFERLVYVEDRKPGLVWALVDWIRRDVHTPG